jgi:hypothetical protein
MKKEGAYFSFEKPWMLTLYASVVSFGLYTTVFAFRKAFSVAAFEGDAWEGLSYKVLLVIAQVAGYMLSKFYGIRFIAELNRLGRGKLLLMLVGISWLAWLVFAWTPRPWNAICLIFNGFPLGIVWGIVFSYVEGRRATDVISAALAVSFIFASGLAKSAALWLMEYGGVAENWMPFATGGLFVIPLLMMVYFMEKLPPPDAADEAARTVRLPMMREERADFLRKFYPGIIALVLIYVLVTILREVRDSFMADMWRESGTVFQTDIFTKTETIISICILVLIASMVWVKHNYRAFVITQMIMFAGFAICLLGSWQYQKNESMFFFTTTVGLGLYMVYIPFNSILFDRLLAAFRISGNVGFLIYLADAFGYLGSVLVLLSKTTLKLNWNWLSFFQMLVWIAGFSGLVLVGYSLFYFYYKNQKSGVNRASNPT